MFSKARILFALVIAVTAAGCARSGDTAARQHALNGDRFLANGRNSAAIIEYRNAVKLQPAWAGVHAQLARAYEAIGKPEPAYREYSNAAALDPADVQSRLAAGRLLFDAHMYQEAQIRAEQVLDREPKNEQAIVLLARAYGAITLARGDQRGAEAVLRGAVAQVPSSVEAHVALADFLILNQRMADAERELLTTVQAHPTDELANRSLASFYVTTNRPAAAEPYLKAAAAVKDQRYQSSLALADYYTADRRFQDARAVLEPAITDHVQGVPARVRLAAIEEEVGSHQTARQMLDAVLKKNKTPEALALDAQLLLRDDRFEEASASARAALDQDPHLPAANYVAAVIDLKRGQLDSAEHGFREARNSSRLAAAANLQLAQTKLAQRRPADAMEFALAAGDSYDARLTLARALVANGNDDSAREQLTRLESQNPKDAEPIVLLAKVNLSEARFDAARQEAVRALALAPESVDALMIAGQASLATNDMAGAEEYLAKAAARVPSFAATTMLAQVYVSRGELPRAQKMFDDLAQAHPNAAGPYTASGIILEAAGKPAEARVAYERALALDSKDAVASYNLARMYTNDPSRIDFAVMLAQTAAVAAPGEPEVHDALGWAYFKKGNLRSAADELERAVTMSPKDDSYREHLAEVRRALDAEAKQASVRRTAM
ncbi:MAG TPA: tetratricopeptide repeat protein [Vicinamibacterales bacterium]|nr:tetratricopeptide repeat protein [Vicinamibacterales bacterium]